jgi:hypothetical protein
MTETSVLDTHSYTEADWEGLGRLPEHLPSISSLLLFNTQDNPYNVYVSIDNLLGEDRVAAPTDDKDRLADAPTTVRMGEEIVRYFYFILFYCIFIYLFFLLF